MVRVTQIGEYKGIKDAHSIVAEYQRAGMIEQLKRAWKAHPNLTLTHSDEQVSIAPSILTN